MDKKQKCKHCNCEFNLAPRVFSNHVRWCNPNLSNDKLNDSMKKVYDKKYGVLKNFDVICGKCNKNFQVKERDKKFPSKVIYYCSRSCSNNRGARSDEVKSKISIGVKKSSCVIPRQDRVCVYCNKTFKCLPSKVKKFCNNECKMNFIKKDWTKKQNYYSECRFKFNVYHYPEKFDLKLIEKHGWYKAKNWGDNPNGVSRDHRISINYGWENGIASEIISHPANCILMLNSDNIKKNRKCEIELERLIEEIEKWDR